jgi:hypothetical protein
MGISEERSAGGINGSYPRTMVIRVSKNAIDPLIERLRTANVVANVLRFVKGSHIGVVGGLS